MGLSLQVWGQATYWVLFKDRAGALPGTVSARALHARRTAGLPEQQASDAWPVPDYCQGVEALAGQPVRVRSRWLNGVSIAAGPAIARRLAQLPYVAEVRPVASTMAAATRPPTADSLQLSRGLGQVGGAWLAQEGLTGKGVAIGLIDAGFADADESAELRQLFGNGRVKAYRDFEAPANQAFFRPQGGKIDDHGTNVLTLVGGQSAGRRFGGAPDADYYLARTDNHAKEYRREEDHWVAAMEWMDSLGVRLINTSLGYGLGYDDKAENHKPADVDGRSAVVTRAVNVAIAEKGICVVVAAGNDGGNAQWGGIINLPADAPGCIAVGATYLDNWQKLGYSGIGPEGLAYVKPDVSAFSLFGTSFAAPVVTGLLGALMQRHPGLKPQQYADALRQSGHLHLAPNNYLGYGVPNAERAHLVLAGKPRGVLTLRLEARHQAQTTIPGKAQTVVYFHKKDARTVFKQGTLPVAEGRVTVSRPAGAAFTTLALADYVWEIEWKP